MRAVEDALGVDDRRRTRELVRNLIAGSQLVHDHVIHFYHLHALDWVDVVARAEGQTRRATSRLAQSISDWPKSSRDLLRRASRRA